MVVTSYPLLCMACGVCLEGELVFIWHFQPYDGLGEIYEDYENVYEWFVYVYLLMIYEYLSGLMKIYEHFRKFENL